MTGRMVYKQFILVSLTMFALGIFFNPTLLPAQAAEKQQARSILSADQIVATGLDRPTTIAHAGDGSGRLFVVQQTGQIRVIRNGELQTEPFLDITDKIINHGERGLLGLAFHPNYEENGYFYVNYTRQPDGATVIARYSTSGNPNQANPSSEAIILTVPQPYENHNGGQLAFGPDGYLYIGLGDGGGEGDPLNNAQNTQSLLGKILRLEVNNTAPYSIPDDNPFANQGGAEEVWAFGLRNPWRFSFDRRTGDLYIADVGQNKWEEVNFQAGGSSGGQNYGWRCKEGHHVYNSSTPCNDATYLSQLVDPVAEYDHQEGQSITGGYVYRGSDYPTLRGRYFYADFVSGKIWSILPSVTNPWPGPALELDSDYQISSFGEDEAGELYIATYNDPGTIRRLTLEEDPSPGGSVLLTFPLIFR